MAARRNRPAARSANPTPANGGNVIGGMSPFGNKGGCWGAQKGSQAMKSRFKYMNAKSKF